MKASTLAFVKSFNTIKTQQDSGDAREARFNTKGEESSYLPEAILLRNILETTIDNVELLINLKSWLECKKDSDKEIRQKFKFHEDLREQILKIKDFLTGHFDQDDFVKCTREILLIIHNDKQKLKAIHSIQSQGQSSHDDPEYLCLLGEMCEFAVKRILQPFALRNQEINALCNTITQKKKFEVIKSKLFENLQVAEKETEDVNEEKSEETDMIKNQIESVVVKSKEQVESYKEAMFRKVKTLSWMSHARQTRTLETVMELKRELDTVVDEHVTAETRMRRTNARLESEIKEMIDRYDREMFQRHQAIDNLILEYDKEKEALFQLMEKLAEIEEAEKIILAEQQAKFDAIREERLKNIRRKIAAKTIQRAWRAFKTRQMLKKRKRKKKSAAAK